MNCHSCPSTCPSNSKKSPSRFVALHNSRWEVQPWSYARIRVLDFMMPKWAALWHFSHELLGPLSTHNGLSLTHESGWCVSAFGSGFVCFENVETGDGPWHMRGPSTDAVLKLWELLAQGQPLAISACGGGT